MNILARIPFWGWYLFSVVFCYAIWNPYYSLYQLLSSGADPAIKTICVVIAVIVASLYAVEGHRTLNWLGITLFVALFVCIFWLASKAGIHSSGTIQYWGHFVVALLLTIALQGGRIYRSLTGRVPVTSSVDDADHHHA